jgi:hypothetical protein
MSLDYHLVDPLGDDEKDEQQIDVLDVFWLLIRRLLAEKLDKKRRKSCQQLANPSNPSWPPKQ